MKDIHKTLKNIHSKLNDIEDSIRKLGVDIEKGSVFDSIENFIWEPLNVKISAIQATVEIVSILSNVTKFL